MADKILPITNNADIFSNTSTKLFLTLFKNRFCLKASNGNDEIKKEHNSIPPPLNFGSLKDKIQIEFNI